MQTPASSAQVAYDIPLVQHTVRALLGANQREPTEEEILRFIEMSRAQLASSNDYPQDRPGRGGYTQPTQRDGSPTISPVVAETGLDNPADAWMPIDGEDDDEYVLLGQREPMLRAAESGRGQKKNYGTETPPLVDATATAATMRHESASGNENVQQDAAGAVDSNWSREQLPRPNSPGEGSISLHELAPPQWQQQQQPDSDLRRLGGGPSHRTWNDEDDGEQLQNEIPRWRVAEAEAFERRRHRILAEYGLLTGDADLRYLRQGGGDDLPAGGGSLTKDAALSEAARDAEVRRRVRLRAAREEAFGSDRFGAAAGGVLRRDDAKNTGYFFRRPTQTYRSGGLNADLDEELQLRLSRKLSEFQAPPRDQRFACQKLAWCRKVYPVHTSKQEAYDSLYTPLFIQAADASMASLGEFATGSRPESARMKVLRLVEQEAEAKRRRQASGRLGVIVGEQHSAQRPSSAAVGRRDTYHNANYQSKQHRTADPVKRARELHEQGKKAQARLEKECRKAIWEYRCVAEGVI